MPALLRTTDLVKHFPVRSPVLQRTVGQVEAVDGVSLAIDTNDTLGIVGESGSGKSTLARMIVRIVDTTSGAIEFDGVDVLAARGDQLRQVRRGIQMVFQDPYSSLDPRMTVARLVTEPLRVHRSLTSHMGLRLDELLHDVGLSSRMAIRYPHQLSGGQRQRVAIARALAPHPKLVLLDEPTSGLDVSIQAQVLNLLQSLQESEQLSYLFISHDLAVIRYLSHRVGVLYLGRLVELGSTHALFTRPLHPYTVTLLDAVPRPDPDDRRQRLQRVGDQAARAERPSMGCRFHPRCPLAQNICREQEPRLAEHEPRHFAACHFPGKLSRTSISIERGPV